jgi:hypothetical protein
LQRIFAELKNAGFRTRSVNRPSRGPVDSPGGDVGAALGLRVTPDDHEQVEDMQPSPTHRSESMDGVAIAEFVFGLDSDLSLTFTVFANDNRWDEEPVGNLCADLHYDLIPGLRSAIEDLHRRGWRFGADDVESAEEQLFTFMDDILGLPDRISSIEAGEEFRDPLCGYKFGLRRRRAYQPR